MKPASLFFVFAFVVLVASHATLGAAHTRIVHGIVRNEEGTATEQARVVFTPLAPGGQPISGTTDVNGTFNLTQVPAATYQVEVLSPENPSEIWYRHRILITKNHTGENRLEFPRAMPHVTEVQTPQCTQIQNACAQRGKGTLLSIRMDYAGPGPDEIPLRLEVYHIDATSTPTRLSEETRQSIQRKAPNVTRIEMGAAAPHAWSRETGPVTLRIELRDDSTTTKLYDQHEFFLEIVPLCAPPLEEFYPTLPQAPAELCIPPAETTQWTQWQTKAEALLAASQVWAAWVDSNLSAGQLPAALQAWQEYQNSTRTLRQEVHGFLDARQTDTAPTPPWSQLQELRRAATHQEEAMRHALAQAAAAPWNQGERQIASETQAIHGLLLAGVVGGVVLGGACAYLPVQQWRRRAEYWVGYSSTGPRDNPLFFTAILSVGILIAGLIVAWILGLPLLIDWLSG